MRLLLGRLGYLSKGKQVMSEEGQPNTKLGRRKERDSDLILIRSEWMSRNWMEIYLRIAVAAATLHFILTKNSNRRKGWIHSIFLKNVRNPKLSVGCLSSYAFQWWIQENGRPLWIPVLLRRRTMHDSGSMSTSRVVSGVLIRVRTPAMIFRGKNCATITGRRLCGEFFFVWRKGRKLDVSPWTVASWCGELRCLYYWVCIYL